MKAFKRINKITLTPVWLSRKQNEAKLLTLVHTQICTHTYTYLCNFRWNTWDQNVPFLFIFQHFLRNQTRRKGKFVETHTKSTVDRRRRKHELQGSRIRAFENRRWETVERVEKTGNFSANDGGGVWNEERSKCEKREFYYISGREKLENGIIL